LDKLIITAALTGAVTMPTQTPHLPITPQQLADEAVRAAEAGAASVHIHARNPENGMPTSDLEVYGEIVSRIKQRSDVIICITTGGAVGADREKRIAVVPRFKPELASFNMGSMNFSIHPIAERYEDKDYKYAWEKGFILGTKENVFRNTFSDIEYFCETMKQNGTRPECEAYDVGHIYNIAYLASKKLLQLPIWMQFVTGVLGGIGSSLEDIMYMKQTSDRLFGKQNYRWSVIGVGYPDEFKAATLAIMMGGHVRVGLEDNIFVKKGKLAKSNAELVEKVVRIAGEFERDIATPDEARKILNLKGKNKVGY
jgi:uncharacterized protein (DUF849 family)